MTDLRIVLLGEHSSGKSSAGNTILTGSGFKAGQRSVQCEVRQGEVAGRQVTVVDPPGWYYNSSLQDTSEMDKLEIQNSVCLCPPGPHAALLTVPLDRAFTKAQRVALEEHMTLMPQRSWSHSIVLFTNGDFLGDRSIEQHIEAEGEDLCWLVDRCGNRYHVFNNKKRDDTQVTQLLQKIEVMLAGNTGGHCEVDGEVCEKISERKRNMEEHVQTFVKKTHRHRNALKALSEGEHQSLSDVRLMLVGGEQKDRNRAANLILGDVVFTETSFKEFKTQTKLTECVREQRRVADRKVSVVNSPDLSTTPPSQKIKDVLLHGVTLCSPGPHAVLLTVNVMSSFSEAARRSVEEHMELLGDTVWRHTLVLFMWGVWLGGRRVEEYIEAEGEPLRWILEKCGYWYHVLDGNKWDISEVTELMETTEDMVTRNRGHFEPSVYAGHLKVGHETRQKTLFDRLKGKNTLTREEWNRREEMWKKREQEMIEKMLRFVLTQPEEPTLPEEWTKREEEMRDKMLRFLVMEPGEPALSSVSRRNSMDLEDVSVGTPSETGSLYSWSPDKASSSHPGSIAPSSGYDSYLTDNISSSYHGSVAPSSGYGSRSDVQRLGSSTDVRVPLMKKMFPRLRGKQRRTEEDWNRRQEQWRRREQEIMDRMLMFVMMEPEEPSPPSMSGGTPSETGSLRSPDKVYDWLLKMHPGPIESSLGADITSEAPPLPALYVNMSSEEEEDSEDKACMDMMKMMKIQSGEEGAGPSPSDVSMSSETLQISFSPSVHREQTTTGYRFTFPGAGLFHCRNTGLVFKTTEGTTGEVQYKTVQWDEEQLQSTGGAPAGPLYDIQSPQEELKICQLHLPHCEVVLDGLSVVHVSDEGVNFLKPLEVTKTHVVVEVTHLSLFGLISKLFNRIIEPTPTLGQVLLLLRQPISHILEMKVLLLPSNVDIEKVLSTSYNREDKYINTHTECLLTREAVYSLHCPPHVVQPENSLPYHLNYGPNYTPTFVVEMDLNTKVVPLELHEGPERKLVWKHNLSLKGMTPRLSVPGPSAVTEPQVNLTPDHFVGKNFKALVQRVTAVMPIADDLFGKDFLTIETYNKIHSTTLRQDQVREILLTVLNQGTAAITAFYQALQKEDLHLFEDLAEGPGR